MASAPSSTAVARVVLKRLDLAGLLGIDPLLAQAPLLRAVAPDARDALVASGAIRRLAAGEPLFGEGEPGTSLLLVLRGEVRLARGAPAPREWARVRKGDLFGEGELLGGPRAARLFEASAVVATDLAEFPEEALRPLVASTPALHQLLARVRDERARPSAPALPWA